MDTVAKPRSIRKADVSWRVWDAYLAERRIYKRWLRQHGNPQAVAKENARSRCYTFMHPEYCTVLNHYHYIFTKAAPAYDGMPFFDGWNPNKGGSFKAGGQWIINNLGPKPTEGRYNLHIVDRRIGFMPNNLQWVPKAAHKREELIPQLLLEIQNLKQNDEIYEVVLG